MLEDDKPESTPVESNKDEDEAAMAEEKDASETKEVNASSEEIVLNSKQRNEEEKKKASKSAANEEDAPNDFKVDYKGKQLNAMDVGEDEDDNEDGEKPV